MRRIMFYLRLPLLVLFCGTAEAFYHQDSTTTPPSTENTRIIVKLKSGLHPSLKLNNNGFTSLGISSVDQLSREKKIIKQEFLFKKQALDDKELSLDRILIMQAPPGSDVDELAASYESLSEVEYAHPDYRLELYELPNDSLFGDQWALNNTGQSLIPSEELVKSADSNLKCQGGTPGADIHAAEVFENPPDRTWTVIVAVVDTGIDIEHPDLAERIWTNPGEIPDNGIDDDHNGYIDDVHGWDLSGDNPKPVIIPDNDPSDTYGHGTHCAGIISAVTNNQIGIAGIIDDCEIMPLKFYPWMLSSLAAEAIIYAADNGADVINMSFGYSWRIQLLDDALAYARAKGVVLCAAAGNTGTDCKNYPAASFPSIAISATNNYDLVTSFSTYGEHISLCAPGETILSLRGKNTDMYADYEDPYTHIVAENYYLASGTSMAAPHVAGVAAYIRAVSPGYVPDSVQTLMEMTADDILYSENSPWEHPGKDRYSGYGRINLFNALQNSPRRRIKIEYPNPNQVVSGTISIYGTCEAEDFQEYILEYGHGGNPTEWNQILTGSLPLGSDILGQWNTSGLTGRYTVRARLGQSNIAMTTVTVINSTKIDITDPDDFDTVSCSTEITGSAVCPDFDYYKLEYASELTPDNLIEITRSSRPVDESSLGIWEAGRLPGGTYSLKLSVYSTDSQVQSTQISLVNYEPFSSPNNWKISLEDYVSNLVNYGDFDLDGVNEIVVGTENGLKFFTTEGIEKYHPYFEMPDFNMAATVAVGDLNGDGKDDLIAFGNKNVDSKLRGVLFGLISSCCTFEKVLPNTVNLDRYGDVNPEIYPYLSLRDINGDHKDEVLSNRVDTTELYTWDALNGFTEMSVGKNRFLPADLNNDGYDEIYAAEDSILYRIEWPDEIIDSFNMKIDEIYYFKVCAMSAFDIDRDHKLELIIYAYDPYISSDYWLYAFDENLSLKEGWPHCLGINNYLVPSNPVFCDLDDNGQNELYVSLFEWSQSMIHCWTVDGFSVSEDAGSSIWSWPKRPGIAGPPLVVDITGDGRLDIVADVRRDMFHTYKVERLEAWDRDGRTIEGWPMTIVPNDSSMVHTGLHIPCFGDINRDGYLDVVSTTTQNELYFINFEGVIYDSILAPVPSWRYNRRLNNIGPSYFDSISTDVEYVDTAQALPERFELAQNSPNPFNAVTVIEFSLPASNHVNLNIYNILGQKIDDRDLGLLEAGNYSITWEASDKNGKTLSSGIYFYEIRTESFAASKKMLLLK